MSDEEREEREEIENMNGDTPPNFEENLSNVPDPYRGRERKKDLDFYLGFGLIIGEIIACSIFGYIVVYFFEDLDQFLGTAVLIIILVIITIIIVITNIMLIIFFKKNRRFIAFGMKRAILISFLLSLFLLTLI